MFRHFSCSKPRRCFCRGCGRLIAQEAAVSSTCRYDSVLLLPSVRQSPVVIVVGCFDSSVVLNLVDALHTVCKVSFAYISLLVVVHCPLQHRLSHWCLFLQFFLLEHDLQLNIVLVRQSRCCNYGGKACTTTEQTTTNSCSKVLLLQQTLKFQN